MSGKGSAPRPFDVPREVFESNHARIFGDKPVKERYIPPPLPNQQEVKQPIAAAVRAAERIDAMHKGVVSVFAALKAEHMAASRCRAEGGAHKPSSQE